ncbi:hypothetical protein CRG98_029626 [Punica granatum]|uniref:Uncharacterized protein n=1 Tax=Punica granatum TaxID=22663 RepID=A0A2I0J1S2_PUNGR|nr:hypothetical protein CRG98_029626 [Punica granatum]
MASVVRRSSHDWALCASPRAIRSDWDYVLSHETNMSPSGRDNLSTSAFGLAAKAIACWECPDLTIGTFACEAVARCDAWGGCSFGGWAVVHSLGTGVLRCGTRALRAPTYPLGQGIRVCRSSCGACDTCDHGITSRS